MQDLESAPCRRPETRRHYERAIERVISAMHESLDEGLSLEDMANVAIMSPFYLNRVFRQVTGVPPCRFLTALRLEAAKRLLLSSELSVTDISLEVGYNSLGTFTRRFSELVGLPPGRFRGLSKSGARAAIHRLREASDLARLQPVGRGLRGQVEVPEGFSGPIFIGLFETAVPQSRPRACALVTSGGSFRLTSVPDGRYYLVSVGLAWSLNPRDYLLYDKALRGGTVGRQVVIRDGENLKPIRLALRPPRSVDPPILMTLPLLVGERLARSKPVAGATVELSSG